MDRRMLEKPLLSGQFSARSERVCPLAKFASGMNKMYFRFFESIFRVSFYSLQSTVHSLLALRKIRHRRQPNCAAREQAFAGPVDFPVVSDQMQ